MRLQVIIALLTCTAVICCKGRSKGSPNSFRSGDAIKEPVDSIVVIKSKRSMQLYHHQRLLKEYRVCLGPQPVGAKHFRNDGKTPEGLYYINGKNPNSHYHKALGVSYPSPTDVAYARSHGKPSGGDIKIHGFPNSFNGQPDAEVTDDWTLGCIALNNAEIDELYAHVSVGAWLKHIALDH